MPWCKRGEAIYASNIDEKRGTFSLVVLVREGRLGVSTCRVIHARNCIVKVTFPRTLLKANQNQQNPFHKGKKMAGVAGLEPVTSAVTGQRSNQLSYTPA